MAVPAMAAPQITEAAVVAVLAQLVAMELLVAGVQAALGVLQVFLVHPLPTLLAGVVMVALAQPQQRERLTAVMAHWRVISTRQVQQVVQVS